MTVEPVDYLYIRILESCNAHCFMCSFAKSKTKYRLGLSEFENIVSSAKMNGIKYIRLTGGEPLIHKNISTFIKIIEEYKLYSSIITNGYLLPGYINKLHLSGINQIVVSIDSSESKIHDKIRGKRNILKNALRGISFAKEKGIMIKVSTVCGIHNYKDLLTLQQLLTNSGVDQWEISAIKLTKKITYNDDEIKNVIHITQKL